MHDVGRKTGSREVDSSQLKTKLILNLKRFYSTQFNLRIKQNERPAIEKDKYKSIKGKNFCEIQGPTRMSPDGNCGQAWQYCAATNPALSADASPCRSPERCWTKLGSRPNFLRRPPKQSSEPELKVSDVGQGVRERRVCR